MHSRGRSIETRCERGKASRNRQTRAPRSRRPSISPAPWNLFWFDWSSQWWAGGGDLKWYPAAPHPRDLEIFLFSWPSRQFSPSLRFGDMRTWRYVLFPLWSLKKKKRNLELCYLAQSGAICFGRASKRRWRIFLRRRTRKESAQTKLPRGHFDGNFWIRTVLFFF